ncbi:MAG: tRNA (adenosine(37)-N6)-dimethylallyltransferase MiaA [Patescibacteria group bacterium]|nr:tRNA (adenosine(37)-N6)-dimethylallyltransferase MiaA [Candidatus Beckwithbacteria bacterium]MDZ4228941.1 tRNA (adenosine(37)-N6)-dimethylallyltransferase MiaA [Patescibacteria group bacterium]
MKKILIVCGPTAIGKTALAVKLAKKFAGELISADSRQVYQGMDIVTGKDKPAGVKLHGLDLVKPDEEFSAAHFVTQTRTLINQIIKRKKLPIIVGGTGLYINSLINPPATLSVKPDWQLRKQLEPKTVKELQNQLKKLGGQRWRQMNHSDRLNPRRLIRAIEVNKFQQGQAFPSERTDLKFNTLWIGLRENKAILDERIAKRVKTRVKAGAIAEWQQLKAKYRQDLESMTGIGYRQLPDIAAWILSEQQYAVRQMTYFKKIRQIHWFELDQAGDIAKLVKAWYTK